METSPAEDVFISSAELFDKDIDVVGIGKGVYTLSPNPYAPLRYFVSVGGGYRGFTRLALARALYNVKF